MTDIYGQRAEIGICFQDSYGTVNTDSMHWLPVLSETFAVNREPLVSQNMRGIYDEGDHYEGANNADGELSMEAMPIPAGALLKAVLGDPTTVTSDALYTHTFKPPTSDFDKFAAVRPFTVHRYFNTGSAELIYDLVGNELEFSVANGEFLTMRMAAVGGNHTNQTNVSASYPTGKKWPWDTSSISISASGVTDIRALTVKITNGLEAAHALDSSRGKWPSFVKRSGFRMVEVSGTLRLADMDEYDAFTAQSERNMTINLKGSTEVQSGYPNNLKIILPLLRWTAFPVNAGGVGPVEVSVTGKGVYSSDSATAVHIELMNGQDAY